MVKNTLDPRGYNHKFTEPSTAVNLSTRLKRKSTYTLCSCEDIAIFPGIAKPMNLLGVNDITNCKEIFSNVG